MLAPYISYCPENETRLAWQNVSKCKNLLKSLTNILLVPSASHLEQRKHQVSNAVLRISYLELTMNSRYSPNDTAQDGSENAGTRVADPSVSDVEGDCLSTNVTGYGCYPAIGHNKSEPLSFPGKKVLLQWDAPGQAVGPNNSYVTSTSATGAAAWVGWYVHLEANTMIVN